MKKKFKRNLLWILCSFCIFAFPLQLRAEEANKDNDISKCGYEEPIQIELDESTILEDEIFDAYDAAKYSRQDSSYWQSYSSDYYYNELSENEKQLYQRLDQACMQYLITDGSVVSDVTYVHNNVTMRRAFVVDVSDLSLTKEQTKKVVFIFMYSRPQYYYVSSVYSASANYAGLYFFDEFSDGTRRQIYTDEVQTQLESWVSTAAAGQDAYSKEKNVYDLICNNVSYNDADVNNPYNQSMVSAVCSDSLFNRTTVCAGYAKLYAALCNKLGIETVSVTSSNHAWNKTFLNGYWYAVDTTWGDKNSYISYDYFNKSDTSIQAGNGSHVEESIWNGLAPIAYYDYGKEGDLPKTATPIITAKSAANGFYDVTIQPATGDSTIYYTIDGSTPTGSSMVYQGTFRVNGNCTVKAVSAKAGYRDSDIAGYTITGGSQEADSYWITAWDGQLRKYDAHGNMVKNSFAFDGAYTYYLQADGTPMKDRLTYHPDGEHIIYLDTEGHEVFSNFQYCPSVGYTCYFDSQGYIYKDQITFVGSNVYYLNANGAMEQSGWFRFANGRDCGYANYDGTLKTMGFSYDAWGRIVYYHWNGMVARGLITDGVWYYNMDMTDGHYLGSFR